MDFSKIRGKLYLNGKYIKISQAKISKEEKIKGDRILYSKFITISQSRVAVKLLVIQQYNLMLQNLMFSSAV
jgi:hypothetical protein